MERRAEEGRKEDLLLGHAAPTFIDSKSRKASIIVALPKQPLVRSYHP